MPRRNSRAPSRISGAIPIGSNARLARLRKANNTTPSASANHSAWRNSAPISARRPLPSSRDTAGGSDISVPIGTIIGSQNSAVPTDTAASVAVPWWPAMTASTKPINPVATWPSTSGPASTPVRRTSCDRRADGKAAAGAGAASEIWGSDDMTGAGRDCGRAPNRCRALAPGRDDCAVYRRGSAKPLPERTKPPAGVISAVEPVPQPGADALGFQTRQLAAHLCALLRRGALHQHRQIATLGRRHRPQHPHQWRVLLNRHLRQQWLQRRVIAAQHRSEQPAAALAAIQRIKGGAQFLLL